MIPFSDRELVHIAGTYKVKEMLTEYYMVRDWDLRTGYPKKEKLQTLGLSVDSFSTQSNDR